MLGYFRDEPTFLDESILFLEPPTTGVATRTVTEEPPPVTSSIPFPIAPAPVPVGLAVEPVPLTPSAVALATAPLLTRDTAIVEVTEPPAAEPPQVPMQSARFTNDDILQTDELPKFYLK